ncbi:hypothetical protein IJF93_02900 [Candidatus Saccharibacteria bacterium]|nr:hypothetical protein [Candidatus Saccharibacteria bacterium]
MTGKANNSSSKRDEEYKSSAQQIVDRAMEAQTLAPAIVEAMKENKPLNDELRKMFADALDDDKKFNEKLQESVESMIRNNKNVQEAIGEVVSNSDAIKRSKSPLKTKEFWIPVVVSVISAVAAVAAVVVAVVAFT